MSPELIAVIIAILGPTGGVWAGYKIRANRQLGLKANENEAKRDMSSTWESIATSLQNQIKDLDTRLTKAMDRIDDLDKRNDEKDRIINLQFAHILLLETMIPPKPVPARPKGI